ncbi:CU044_2847 family protein [Streptomyces sp. NPDC058595]|uniref:CU044_2847 family protein n=1 Tax=Streptomyces sp. NPDC058595 TaxID=3346550 RepID=UPI003666C82E
MTDRLVHTVEVPLDEGGEEVIRVQIREVDESVVRVGRGRSVARAGRSLGQMLDTVRPVAESFVGRFQELAVPPDEMTLEFGVSLSAGADVVIASTATTANFTVSLSWSRRDTADSTGNNSQGS